MDLYQLVIFVGSIYCIYCSIHLYFSYKKEINAYGISRYYMDLYRKFKIHATPLQSLIERELKRKDSTIIREQKLDSPREAVVPYFGSVSTIYSISEYRDDLYNLLKLAESPYHLGNNVRDAEVARYRLDLKLGTVIPSLIIFGVFFGVIVMLILALFGITNGSDISHWH